MTKKILVTGSSVRSEFLRPLVEAGYVVENPPHLLSESALKEALGNSVAYLLGGDEYASRNALASAKGLKVIAFLGMGYQSFVDVAAAKEFNIPITNTPGTLSNSVAEFTVGLLLNSTRRMFLYASEYTAGRSGKEEKERDLSSLHVGIVGLGGVGTRIAEIIRNGFNSRVSYYSRTRKYSEEQRLALSYASLDQLASEVDVLIVMTPATTETRGMIGKDQISKLKKRAIVINSARPDIVDPEALLEGLSADQIGYAAFDGFYENPTDLVQSLKKLIPSKLMVTGHIASLTHEARDGMARMATNSILNILTSGRDQHIVNGA